MPILKKLISLSLNNLLVFNIQPLSISLENNSQKILLKKKKKKIYENIFTSESLSQPIVKEFNHEYI